MHPNAAFRWTDEDAMARFVAARGFAHLCIVSEGLPVVAHVPVTVTPERTLRMHLARGNRIVRALDGANAVASVSDGDHYVSPDWYGTPDQVPTWNYAAVEIKGTVHALDDDALRNQVDALSDGFETRLAPKPVWKRAKMREGRFEAMLHAIRGFELRPSVWRGTLKLGQNKSPGERDGLIAALAGAGRNREAAMIRAGGPA